MYIFTIFIEDLVAMRSRVLPLLWLLLAFVSCRSDNSRELLTNLLGSELIIPDSLVCKIQDTPIEYEPSGADFRIVTYIDSAGCVPCRMKMASWKEIIAEYTGISDSGIDFFMILHAPSDSRDLKISLQQFEFPYPVLFDPENEFIKANSLPEESWCHTMLMDGNNEILAAGNPAENPKVRDFFKRIIMKGKSECDNTPHFCEKPVREFGLANCGDTLKHEFVLRNNTSQMATIQGLIPSCNCVTAYASADTLLPGGSITITAKMMLDSIPGPFLKRIDVFYNEIDTKENLTLSGFNNNKINY